MTGEDSKLNVEGGVRAKVELEEAKRRLSFLSDPGQAQHDQADQAANGEPAG